MRTNENLELTLSEVNFNKLKQLARYKGLEVDNAMDLLLTDVIESLADENNSKIIARLKK